MFWYTTSKWNGGFEASSHVRAGIVFRVIDGSDKILFEENIYLAGRGTYAVKTGEFFSDILKNEVQRYKDLFNLVSHEEWRARLAQEKKKHDYSGMMDNWIYCESDTDTRVIIDTVKMLGKEKHIVLEKCRHRLCELEWFSVIVTDQSMDITEAICGYAFIERK